MCSGVLFDKDFDELQISDKMFDLFGCSRPEEVEATATLRACVIANQVNPGAGYSISTKCNTGEMSPLCGACDEQVRGKGDHGEEEGRRSKFSLVSLFKSTAQED